MKHKKGYILIFAALLSAISLGLGCLEEPVKSVTIEPGWSGSYEFNLSRDNFSNISTYVLFDNNTVRVVSSMNNSTGLDIVIPESVSAEIKSVKGPGIKNLVIIGNNSNNITNESTFDLIPNTSYISTFTGSREKKKVHIEISHPITGFVAYSYEWEYGQFYLFPARNEVLTIILPSGHDTGNFILGSPRPKPDLRFKDDKGRVNLVWDNPYQDHPSILIKYYRSSLPAIMTILVIVLSAAFLITYVYYKNQIRKLQQKREKIELYMKKRK